ncbi:MAG: tetratricopeptide repeat protein [Vicinamibacterales bacterium]
MTRSARLVPAVAAACWAVLASASVSSAQPLVGRLTGTVKNLAGQPIKAATVRAVNPSTIPNEFTATSDDKGEWAILGMRGGLWEVTASAPGFEASTVAVRVAISMHNSKVQFVLVGTPVRGAMDGVDTKRLQAMLSEAESLMAQEKWDEAAAEYRNILARAPALDMVNVALGRALLSKRDYDGAAAAYGEVLKKDARNQRALVGLGRAQYGQGNRAAAIATLEQAVAIDDATSDAGEARAILAEIR